MRAGTLQPMWLNAAPVCPTQTENLSASVAPTTPMCPTHSSTATAYVAQPAPMCSQRSRTSVGWEGGKKILSYQLESSLEKELAFKNKLLLAHTAGPLLSCYTLERTSPLAGSCPSKEGSPRATDRSLSTRIPFTRPVKPQARNLPARDMEKKGRRKRNFKAEAWVSVSLTGYIPMLETFPTKNYNGLEVTPADVLFGKEGNVPAALGTRCAHITFPSCRERSTRTPRTSKISAKKAFLFFSGAANFLLGFLDLTQVRPSCDLLI